MCTVLKFVSDDFFFCRTLDNDCSYNEEMIITPRRRKLRFRDAGVTLSAHYAMLGIATVMDGEPLYYDGCNEKGLAMAGLNFVGNAKFNKKECGKDNITSFEIIPWILAQCATVEEARRLLDKINITDTQVDEQTPIAELHWILADRNSTLVIESEADGLHVYDNPIGVLTNNPPFPLQLFNLNNYMRVSAKPPENEFSDKIKLYKYSRGMGGMGLPGDLSSQSRFVRAAFTALNSTPCRTCEENVSQVFHIIGSVDQTRGCCLMDNGEYETTIYTICCDASKGVYYYTTYNNHRISAVDMNKVNLEGSAMFRYPLIKTEQIFDQN